LNCFGTHLVQFPRFESTGSYIHPLPFYRPIANCKILLANLVAIFLG
jgi:hypothetical protein